MRRKVWECKIGFADLADFPVGADLPMRQAVADAFKQVTGKEPDFIFSRWGARLTEHEERVVKPFTP